MSPFFNTHKETLDFFLILERFYPDFEEDKVNREFVFTELYPDKTEDDYNDSQMRTLRKYLLNKLTHFLAYQSWKNDSLAVQLDLIDYLSTLGEPKILEKYIQRGRSLAKQKELTGSRMFAHQFDLEIHALTFHVEHRSRKQIADLSANHKYLDWFFFLNKLKLYASSLNSELIFNEQIVQNPTAEFSFRFVGDFFEDFPPVIQAYYLGCKLLKFREKDLDVDFYRMKEIVRSCGENFENEDFGNLYVLLISIANQKYISGNGKYIEEMFEVYKDMLEHKLLFDGEIFPVHNYKNLVTLGLRNNQLEWTEEFMEEYIKFVPVSYREDVYTYNKAHLYIYQDRFSDALKLLQMMKFLDTFYQLGAKMLQLKIYYEQSDVETFFNFAKTFQNNIRRQKDLPESRKKAYDNFVKLCRNLFRVKIQEKDFSESILEEIEMTQPIIEKHWLKDKLNQMV
ncbi:MAG: hypothetical protein AAFY71_21200 [Bacteroidota bacterium]